MTVLIEGAEYNPANNTYSVYVGDRFEGKSVEFRPFTSEEIHEFYECLEEESKKDSFNLLDILKLFIVKSMVVPCLTDIELLNVCGITIRRDGVYEYFGYNKETETLGTIETTKEKAEIHALCIIFLPAEIEIMTNFICRQIQARGDKRRSTRHFSNKQRSYGDKMKDCIENRKTLNVTSNTESIPYINRYYVIQAFKDCHWNDVLFSRGNICTANKKARHYRNQNGCETRVVEVTENVSYSYEYKLVEIGE